MLSLTKYKEILQRAIAAVTVTESSILQLQQIDII